MTRHQRGHHKKYGGHAGVVEPARELVTDVGTAARIWPFAVAASQPAQGVPLGVDPSSHQLVCYDPYSWFQAGRQRAAQLAILAANGLGKSALAKKMVTGLASADIPAIIPADFKGEYVPLVTKLGGTTQRVGRNGGLNLLDPGEAIHLATASDAPAEVIDELVNRRDHCVATVIAINRGQPLQDWESLLLSKAVNLLPLGSTIHDLPDVFTTNIDDLAGALRIGLERTEELVEPLALSVAALASGPIGRALGTSGAHQAWPINKPLAVDTSTIPQAERQLTAAVMVTSWTAALSAIHLRNATEVGHVHAVFFDEIWRATRQFPDLNDEIGAMLRMDRHEGIVSVITTHSWTDTQQPGGSNILARCAAFALGGMQAEEINTIATAGIGLTAPELAQIRHNVAGGTDAIGAVGGVGRFLLKINDGPGQSLQTILTDSELELLDTNLRWRPNGESPSLGGGVKGEASNGNGNGHASLTDSDSTEPAVVITPGSGEM